MTVKQAHNNALELAIEMLEKQTVPSGQDPSYTLDIAIETLQALRKE